MKINIKCPFCSQKLRIPINKGKLLITCPICQNKFISETSNKSLLNNLLNKFLKNKKSENLFEENYSSKEKIFNPILKGIIIYLFLILFLVLFTNKCEFKKEKIKRDKTYETTDEIKI